MPIRDKNGNIIESDINLNSFRPCRESLWEHSIPIDRVKQCLKILNFDSDTLNEAIVSSTKKPYLNITKEDIERFNRYKNYSRYLEVLTKHKQHHGLTHEEYETLDECLYENLEKIILDKLSKNELLKLKETLNKYYRMPIGELKPIILEYEKNYDNLSLLDASIYYYFSLFYYQKDYIINMHRMDEECYKKMKTYNYILMASKYYASRKL